MMKTMGLLVLGLLLVGLTILATRQPNLVEYDMNDTVINFHRSIENTELSAEQREKEIARFTKAHEDVIRDYAKRHNAVVLVSPAVVSGTVDVTKIIQNSLLEALQAQNTVKRNKTNEVTP